MLKLVLIKKRNLFFTIHMQVVNYQSLPRGIFFLMSHGDIGIWMLCASPACHNYWDTYL